MARSARLDTILGVLETRGRAEVGELAQQLGVSDITVRRDLIDLEKSGFIRRVHGGAVHVQGRSYDRPYSVRSEQHQEAKRAIARAASRHVQAGDAVGLDVGSTVLALVDELRAPNLTLLTANLRTAWAVSQSPNLLRPYRLIVAGGVVRDEELSMSGEEALSHYRKLRPDIAFIGVSGVDVHGGLTDYNLDDAELKRVLVDSARRVIVLADSSKLGRENFVQVADLSRADLLITDNSAQPKEIQKLRDSGLDVEVASAGFAVLSAQP